MQFPLYKMSQYFPKPCEPFSGDINVKVDLSNYATKADIKNISHVDTSSFALKTNLVNLKTEVDKLDFDKLKPVPTDLSKLSNVVKNDAVKKADYNKLVTKVDNIDTTGFVLEARYNTDKSELENKTPGTSGLVKNTDYKTKITEIEGKTPDISNLATKTALTTVKNKIHSVTNLATKTLANKVENRIPDISNLATKTALTAVENKIPNISNLVKKTYYNTKVTEIENKFNNRNHDKYIDTSEFNKLAVDVFNVRISQAKLITKTDFDAKLSSLNSKIAKHKTKNLLVESEFHNLKYLILVILTENGILKQMVVKII